MSSLQDHPPSHRAADRSETLRAAVRALRDAEADRVGKPRPARILGALAKALAEHCDERSIEPADLSVDEVRAFVDGPGLDVILDQCVAGWQPMGRPRDGDGSLPRPPRLRVKRP